LIHSVRTRISVHCRIGSAAVSSPCKIAKNILLRQISDIEKRIKARTCKGSAGRTSGIVRRSVVEVHVKRAAAIVALRRSDLLSIDGRRGRVAGGILLVETSQIRDHAAERTGAPALSRSLARAVLARGYILIVVPASGEGGCCGQYLRRHPIVRAARRDSEGNGVGHAIGKKKDHI